MSLIGSTVRPFAAKAVYESEFLDISQENLANNWSGLFFYPADFTFVCPTELEDLAEKYNQFQSMVVEIYSVSTDTHHTLMA